MDYDPLSSTDAVTTAAALTSWPRGPDQHFGNDIAWNPSANLFIDVQMFRPGGVTKFILEGGDTTGEVVVGEVPLRGLGLPPSGTMQSSSTPTQVGTTLL